MCRQLPRGSCGTIRLRAGMCSPLSTSWVLATRTIGPARRTCRARRRHAAVRGRPAAETRAGEVASRDLGYPRDLPRAVLSWRAVLHDYRGLQHRGSRAHVARCCFNILAPRDLARNAMVTMTAPPPGPHPLIPQTPQSRPLYPSSPSQTLKPGCRTNTLERTSGASPGRLEHFWQIVRFRPNRIDSSLVLSDGNPLRSRGDV